MRGQRQAVQQTISRTVEKLSEVKEQADFKMLYKNSNLKRTRDKINFLRKNLGILAIRCDAEVSPPILLADLEEYALTHPWRCK